MITWMDPDEIRKSGTHNCLICKQALSGVETPVRVRLHVDGKWVLSTMCSYHWERHRVWIPETVECESLTQQEFDDVLTVKDVFDQ